ncbi:RNA polymerase sigma factor [Streptomyces djakartensis]|uniref:RNA polymerase sigma factor n=1 Tax=Streptomyces djakartensis TaxID=68193 RepID=UPI0035717361
MRQEPQRRGHVQGTAGSAVGVRRGDPQHRHQYGERREPQARRGRTADDGVGESGRTAAQPGEQGRRRTTANGHLGHARHAANDTRFPVVTSELPLCRSIYVYVLFCTEGRPVTLGENARRGAGGSTLAERNEDIRFLTADQAFDALYSCCAPALVRQTYLLTGRRELAREAVERAFHTAWQRWPEVARDPDPAGWVRAVAYDCALSPWHRFRLRHRHPEPPPSNAFDRALMETLLMLPPSYRRTLLLYDGVGLGLPETAAETEASTRAAANRLMHAREAVAERLPELADPEVLHWRLVELASAVRLRAGRPLVVRHGGERRARLWTRAAIAFTTVLIGTTALTVRTAPTRYEPPVPAGETVQGVPPPVAPGPLSESERQLREKLRTEQRGEADRLLPQPR